MAYDPTDWGTADDTAKDTAQHFFTDNDGAHVTETAEDPTTGNNVLIDSGGMYVRSGTDNLARFGASGAQVGKDDDANVNMSSSGITMTVPWWSYDFITQQLIYKGVKRALSISYDDTESSAVVESPESALTLQSSERLTVWSDSDMIIRTDFGESVNLIADNVVILNAANTQLWSGTAQQLADALNFKATAPRIYNGVKTVNVGSTSQTSAMIWTAAQFESAFNVSSGHAGDCGVMLCNGNVQAGQLGAVSAEWWNSSYNPYGWRARWTIGATGNKAFSYVVTVPASYSTV